MVEEENLNPQEILENVLFLTDPSKFNAELFNGMRIILQKLSSIEEKIDKFNFFNVEDSEKPKTHIEVQENPEKSENKENIKNKSEKIKDNLMERLNDVEN